MGEARTLVHTTPHGEGAGSDRSRVPFPGSQAARLILGLGGGAGSNPCAPLVGRLQAKGAPAFTEALLACQFSCCASLANVISCSVVRVPYPVIVW